MEVTLGSSTPGERNAPRDPLDRRVCRFTESLLCALARKKKYAGLCVNDINVCNINITYIHLHSYFLSQLFIVYNVLFYSLDPC